MMSGLQIRDVTRTFELVLDLPWYETSIIIESNIVEYKVKIPEYISKPKLSEGLTTDEYIEVKERLREYKEWKQIPF